MKKAVVFLMALIMLFFFCACSATAKSTSGNNIYFKNKNEGFKQLPDLDMGQNLYEDFNKEKHDKTSFVVTTPFGPININQIPPFFDVPLQWNQKYGLSCEDLIV